MIHDPYLSDEYHLCRADYYNGGNSPPPSLWVYVLLLALLLILLIVDSLWAGVRIPGVDAADSLEAAGTVLRIVDTAIFQWGARLFSGICILSAGHNLKEQRFGVAVICVVAAIIFGTAPVWVENIFTIGGGDGIFK